MHASEGNKWTKHALSIARPGIVGDAKLFSSDEERTLVQKIWQRGGQVMGRQKER